MDNGLTVEAFPKKGLAEFLHDLDEKSRDLLYYLWWRRHAEISQLRDIAGSGDDFEVLYRLKEIINLKAQNLWGKPLVGFERARIDPLTGKKILFSWWYLDEEDDLASLSGPAFMDIFDEKDDVILIARLPSQVDIASARINVNNGILKVNLKKIAPPPGAAQEKQRG